MLTIPLPDLINNQVQDAMADVFETLASNPSPTFSHADFQATKPFYEKAMSLLQETDYLNIEQNKTIIEMLQLEIESQTSNQEDQLLFCWSTMKENLEKATSQDQFNATFALFVPLILMYLG